MSIIPLILVPIVVLAAAAPAHEASPNIQALRVETAPNGPTTVVVESDGALPTPAVGVLEGPPRIYLDFAGVRPATTSVIANGDPWVRRVRIALHSDPPPVTRVVIDLFRSGGHRIEFAAGSPSRVAVLIGEGAAKPAASLPARTAAPQTPEAYIRQVTAALARLEKLRPILTSIDTRAIQPGINLQVAIDDLIGVRRTLEDMKPTPKLASTHDRLLQSCALGIQAIQRQMEATLSGNPGVGWSAASAAAGALLLLDRARAELGSP